MTTGTIMGCQTPSTFIGPAPDEYTDESIAYAAFSLLKIAGFELLPWQEFVLKHWFTIRGDKWACSQWGLSVPRQNGKNYLLEAREFVGLALLGERIIHTAHSTQTAKIAFERLCKYFTDDSMPEFKGMCKRIYRADGRQSIELTNDGAITFLCRQKNTARGFTIDTLICDEAQELGQDAFSALEPTISAGSLKNSQAIFTGTPPSLVANSEVFTRMRDQCLDADTPFMSGWMEWAANEDDDIDDPTAWAKGNPSLGYVLSPDSFRASSTLMNRDEFYRERLGAWTGYVDDQVIPTDAWMECVDQSFTDDSMVPVAIAVDMNLTRDAASIVACGQTIEGALWVEVIDHRTGRTDWLVPKLASIVKKQNVKCLCVDLRANAASIIEPLRKLGYECTIMDTNEVKLGCAMFFDAVISRELVHLSQPPLNAAVVAGRKRIAGDAWLWSRGASNDDITPLVAASYALWGQQTEKYKPVERLASVSYFD